MRPKHWVKNLILFLPFLVSGSYHPKAFFLLLNGVIAFSLMASGIYIINDIRDITHDKLHPLKRNRPLASGTINPTAAKRLAVLLVFSSLIYTGYLQNVLALFIIFLYFLVNILYTFNLKGKKYFDIIILTSFFMMRLHFGSSLSKTTMTEWFSLTFLFAFTSLVAGKRYMELEHSLIGSDGKASGRDYSVNDLLSLKIVAFLFAVASMLLLNLYIILEKEYDNVFILSIINLLSVYVILDYFDSKHIKDDDVVERISKKKYIIIFSALLLCFVIWMNLK